MLWRTDPPTHSFTVTLDRQVMQQWSGWTNGARNYIARKDPLILLESVEEYAAQMEDLYQWFFDQFAPLHNKEPQAVTAMRTKARELLDWDDTSRRPRKRSRQ